MNHDYKPARHHDDSPRDKPGSERVEHANLERPGAQAHPRAAGWRPSAGDAWRR